MIKLYRTSILPQLSALFSSTTYDNKVCYLIGLNSGYTEKDLNKCLSPHASGAAMAFDITRAAPVCTVLGQGAAMGRSLAGDVLSFSTSNIICTAEGKPTHVVFGTICPMLLTIGQDIKVLYPNTETDVDATGDGSIVYVPAFSITLGGLV